MLTLGLRAKNSSGTQRLFFDKEENDEFSFTLVGEYKGEPIQIDFESMTGEEIEDLICLVRARKPESKQGKHR